MTQNLTSARGISPGKVLHRELQARGWTQKYLAKIMGFQVETIKAIILGNKEITLEIAIGLSQVLGTSAEFWINLEAKYQLHLSGEKR